MTATAAQKVTPMSSNAHFSSPVLESDPALAKALSQELTRQQTQIELIASENIVSRAVLEAQGSVLTNKYAEGYAGRRYYAGCEFVDDAETLAVERIKKLFGAQFANVQPHSGAQANGAVMMAFLQPGDTILGMSLAAGGHLTHGAKPTQSGKWFNAIQYGVRKEDGLLDYDEIAALAKEHQPKMIIAGASAYPRVIDFKRFREIADSVGALLMVDMAHYSGLIAAGVYPNPVPYADVVTSTTHKTLRGPRGGFILTNNEAHAKKLNSAVFPGLQGGPLMHVIAAKAVAFGEALQPSFKAYGQAVLDNARTLASTLQSRGFDILSGGTDCHIVLVDLRSKRLTGKDSDEALERAGLTCNKNAIPFDPQPPAISSGIRLGTPAGTTRGFGTEEFAQVGNLIADVLDGLIGKSGDDLATLNRDTEATVRAKVEELCKAFPIY